MPKTRLKLLLACALAACRTGAPARGGDPGAQAPVVPGIDPSIMDPSVKPCDDFYAYACGGWLKTFKLPPDKPAYNRSFTAIDERNLELLRALAEQDAAGHLDPADRYPDKVGDYWAACMDEEGIEARGTRDLMAAFAAIDEVKDLPSLARGLARLHRAGVFPAFRIDSTQDARDATQIIGEVAQGGLSLPDRDYYLKDDPAAQGIQKAYRSHLTRMLVLAGLPADEAARQTEAIYALERSMASAQWTRVEMRDPERTYNRLNLAGLEKAVPHFPWAIYLSDIGHADLSAFTTTTPPYLDRLEELFDSTPPETWRAYLRWRLLATMASQRALPRAFTQERFEFFSKNFTGAKELEPRWKHCVRSTEGALGFALGQAYARRYFGEDGKEKTKAIVSGIESAMRNDLAEVAWMDQPTRRMALAKLERIVNKVGYPDEWRNYDRLQVDRSSFFQSVLGANAFEVNRDLDKIGKPLDRGEWLMVPPQVNAYYDPQLNEMVFPAGILQPPFFTRGAPDAVNYGAIGVVVGHELTHGFDDQGRQYDALGNLKDWWTPSVGAEFDRRTACVVKQYDGYSAVDDLKVNGKLTLGENIADLGGVRLSYAAYRAARAHEAPVAGFTPEQAFFVAYAQAWCTATRPELLRLRTATDPHSPERWRVDGPLSNLPDFAKAFSCPEGSGMVRPAAERCAVW
ncbi:MAG TPA: M13 family metallopeptidase [Anaeromyxobacteraceae bacterium]|nr:M13 family metallopeptidase [Anaeromyxobacteraceae bacterium]